jgi:mobilome CxxCx(11)CxxC protein
MPIERDAANVLAIKEECWNAALSAYGTAYIFERRSRIFRRRLQVLSYIGFVVPLMIGSLVLGYGVFSALAVLAAIAVAVCIIQSALALWSIIAGWLDQYSYSTTSAPVNYLLSEKFVELASDPHPELQELRHEYEKLQVEDRARQQQDYQQGVNDAEKRMGMRAALRKFRRTCAGCGISPTSMTATDCGVCGRFTYRIS